MLRRSVQHVTRRTRALWRTTLGVGAVSGGTAYIAYHALRAPRPPPPSPPLPPVPPSPAERTPALLTRLTEGLHVALRLLTLLALFAPVLLTYLPLTWTGRTAQWYALLRRQLSLAGPTFVKLAQWAGTRRDLFPPPLCAELSRLHDRNRPHAAQYSRALVEHMLGRPITPQDCWCDAPEGVGAVAQVHRMLVHGHPVAVKVVHPGVAQLISRDLRIIGALARLIDVLPGARWLSLPDEAALFADMMRAQTDLRFEARNLDRFAENFGSGRRAVRFPRPLHASGDVLFESFCDGPPLHAFMVHAGHTAFDRSLGALGLDAFLHMLIADNFVHADMHPGNILVELNPPATPLDRFVEDFYDMSPFAHRRKVISQQEAHAHVRGILSDHADGLITRQERDERVQKYSERLYALGFTPSLVLLDCGLASELDPVSRRNFIDLFSAVCMFDGRLAGQLMVERCKSPELVRDPDVFVLRIQDVILRVRQASLKLSRISFADVFAPVMAAVRAHHVRLAPEFVNVVLAMFVLEGVGRSLDPDTDVLRAALPLLRRWVAEDAGRGGVRAPGWRSALKVWAYVELREYVARIRDWGNDDYAFFGPFAPFVTADSSVS